VRSRFIIAPFLALVFSLSAWAQQKIAVIDMQQALLQTKDGQKAAAELRAKFTPKEQELQKRQAELQAKQEEFRKGENTLSDDKKATLSRDIDSMTRNLQRDSEDARQDVDQEQQRVLNELGQKMMQVLQKYATDKQLTMILDVSGQPNNVLFASNTIDVTRDIIALYDQSAASLTAAPSAPKPAAATPPPAAAPTAAPRRPATPPPAPAPAAPKP
jgi:outer membrane protein